LKNGHDASIAQFHVIQGVEDPILDIHLDMQMLLDKHQQIFETPKGLPPSRGEHDHNIHLIPGSQPPNICPYWYPFSQKNEIEKIIQELLEAGIIESSTSPYSSPVIMVLKKEGDWHMCSDFKVINKITIKDKLSIPVIDDF